MLYVPTIYGLLKLRVGLFRTTFMVIKLGNGERLSSIAVKVAEEVVDPQLGVTKKG
jgi:hypothetical protein